MDTILMDATGRPVGIFRDAAALRWMEERKGLPAVAEAHRLYEAGLLSYVTERPKDYALRALQPAAGFHVIKSAVATVAIVATRVPPSPYIPHQNQEPATLVLYVMSRECWTEDDASTMAGAIIERWKAGIDQTARAIWST
jgi:hypothetical protein